MDKPNDKDFWDNFSKVFQLNVNVTVPKKVTKNDIIFSLLSEGDFIFCGKNGSQTMMNLKYLNEKCDEKKIKGFEELLWGQVKDYLYENRGVTKNE